MSGAKELSVSLCRCGFSHCGQEHACLRLLVGRVAVAHRAWPGDSSEPIVGAGPHALFRLAFFLPYLVGECFCCSLI